MQSILQFLRYITLDQSGGPTDSAMQWRPQTFVIGVARWGPQKILGWYTKTKSP